MSRSCLRLPGAFLLWCAGLCTAAAAVLAGGASAPPPSPIAAVVAAGDAVQVLNGHSRYWIDPQGDRTVQQVEAAAESIPWRSRDPDQQHRLDHRALWIQFDVVVRDQANWFVEVAAPSTDRAQLFHRDRDGRWVQQEAGEHIAVTAWPVPGRVPTFELAAVPDGQPTRYWLRIQHDRADFAGSVSVVRDTALLAKREREQLLLGAYFGLIALTALAALVHGLAYRDRAFLAFSLYAFLLGFGQLARAGIGAQHLWPDWPFWNEVASSAWPGIPVAGALWFVKVTTEPARLSRALDLGVWALIAAVLGAVAVDIAVATRLSMFLLLVLTGLSLAAILSMVVWGWLDGRDRDLRLVALAFVPMVLVAAFPLARVLGLMRVSGFNLYGLYYGAVLTMPLLYYALHVRCMGRRESMLRAAGLARNDALTGLPHRQGLLERLETSLARARGLRQPCALLAVRVSNLDAIGEEFGREAIDKALVVAASHLRRAIVDFDTAARVGEREFAVLLECPTTREVAVSRAQQVVASGLRQTEALPAALTLKFHVTIAMLPDHDQDAAASLQWALAGLDQITPEAKKAIRPLNF